MAESPSQRPNAPAFLDPSDVIDHTHVVRYERTSVKLDNVSRFCEAFSMGTQGTTGAALLALKERSGLSLAQIAKAGGYNTASGVQRYFNAEYDEPLPPRAAEKLAKALAGKGRPPIQAEDIARLSDYMPTASAVGMLSESGASALVWHMVRRFGVEVELDDPEILRLARLLIALLKVTASRQGLDDSALVEGLFAAADLQARHG